MKTNESLLNKKNNMNHRGYQQSEPFIKNMNPSSQSITKNFNENYNGNKMKLMNMQAVKYMDYIQNEQSSDLNKVINEEVNKLIKPILLRLQKVQLQLNKFKQIIGNNSYTSYANNNFEKSIRKTNQFVLPQEPISQISYPKYQIIPSNNQNNSEFNDEQYLSMTDEELLDYHFKHLRIQQSASSEWKEWFEQMLAIFRKKITHKSKGYPEETKLIIMKFIQFGQQNGNTKLDMIKAAGISNSSYKRWRLPFFGTRKNDDD